MKKNTGLVIGIVAILLLGFGGFVLLNKGNNNQTAAVTGSVSPTTATSQKQSLRSLLSFSGSQKCQYQDPESKSVGVIYLSDGKMRTDQTISTEEATISSHTLVDGQYMYIWTEGSTTGYKSSLTTTVTPPPSGQDSSQNIDLDQQVEFNCQPWTKDGALFSLPSNISFTDISSLLKTPTGGQKSPCDACALLTGDTAAQCKKALNCP
jgi:hypothetical protein